MTRPNPLQFKLLPKYRAPQGHGHSLVVPRLPGFIAELQHNQPVPTNVEFDGQVGSQSLAQLRHEARVDAFRAAITHTRRYRDQLPSMAMAENLAVSSPWLVAGHQPELFHSGVWFKNFLLSRAAQEFGFLPLNLVIDNDLCRSTGIKVPTRDSQQSNRLRLETVLFDAPTAGVAWECRALTDPDCFASFPDRVRKVLLDEVHNPLIYQLWSLAAAAMRRSGKLGLALSESRHALEASLGLESLELPLSQLCNQSAFAKFSLHILARLDRFQQSYNVQRADYRAANQIRNEAHPVPKLASKAGWLEAPWWVYRFSAPARRRLFVRHQGGDLHLSDQAGWQAIIEGPLDSADAAAQWQELALEGALLRPRALITTMFARLVLSDLFMHGIGGGKYDQITDAIIVDFWKLQPPPMFVASSTLHLPIRLDSPSSEHDLIGASEKANPSAQIRQLRYHAEEFISAPSEEALRLMERKRALLQAIPARGEKWNWHREMTSINQRLAELTAEQRRQAELSLQGQAEQEREAKLARSREYSFCLFELPQVANDLRRMADEAVTLPSGK